MTNQDWQAYDDGMLEGKDKANMDDALANNPEARRELEGLAEFKSTLRDAALQDDVPQAKLEAILKGVVKQAKPKRVPWWTLAPVAAAAAVAAVLLSNTLHPSPTDHEVKFDTTPVMARLETNDPRSGALWLASQTHHPAPMLVMQDLPQAQYCGSKYGDGWMAFDFDYRGQRYTIYCRQSTGALDSLKAKPEPAKTFYFDEDCVGWYCARKMCYVVKGGQNQGRWDIARQACLETPNLVNG